jgi:hypothetical protein
MGTTRILAIASGVAVVAMMLGTPRAGAAVDDRGFQLEPGRTINGVLLNRSVDEQAGGMGDTRGNTVLNAGSRGWFADWNGARFDEQISTAVVRSGDQSYHVSNWYRSGVVNSVASPWLVAPAGETGTRDGGGATATSDTFHTNFWFCSGATSVPSVQTFISLAPDDGAGSRWGGYIALQDRFDFGGGDFGLVVRTYNLPNTTNYGYADSPRLQYGEWYNLDWTIVFNDGNRYTGNTVANDIVRLVLRDAGGNVVWQADETTTYPDAGNPTITLTGLTTWEMASWYSGASAINSLQMRLSAQADPTHGSDAYSTIRPAGFYFDDWLIETGAGLQYFTGFEVPEPGMLAGLALGAALLLRRRRAA